MNNKCLRVSFKIMPTIRQLIKSIRISVLKTKDVEEVDPNAIKVINKGEIYWSICTPDGGLFIISLPTDRKLTDEDKENINLVVLDILINKFFEDSLYMKNYKEALKLKYQDPDIKFTMDLTPYNEVNDTFQF